MAMVKQSLGFWGARMGSGASPWRPYMAWRRSACSVLVGSPVEGPPRCTSTMTSGSSRLMANPIVSDLRSSPGPLVVVTPSAPAERGAEGCADAGDLVLGLEGADAELLAAAQFVEDVGGRRDRVATQEQREPGQPRRRR